MGTANSTPIPGGGTEGYHILKVITGLQTNRLQIG